MGSPCFPTPVGSRWSRLIRSGAPAFFFGVLLLTSGLAIGQGTTGPVAPAKPRVYALVAAVGSSFHFVRETRSTGSHLDPYRRSAVEAPDNVLNRIVLHGLDKEIGLNHPESRRVYLAMSAAPMAGVASSQRDNVAIARVVAELEKMPQRLEWDRIVVATPAYKLFEVNGVASKLQGFGISIHPFEDGLWNFFNNRPFDDSLNGEDVVTPDGTTRRTRVYLAPYSYIAIWILDPKTLAILDKQERFDNRKVGDPQSGSLDLSQVVSKEFLARQVIGLIERSIHEAVMHTELAGKVDIREIREVKPGGAER
jgi:hypothetical protein